MKLQINAIADITINYATAHTLIKPSNHGENVIIIIIN